MKTERKIDIMLLQGGRKGPKNHDKVEVKLPCPAALRQTFVRHEDDPSLLGIGDFSAEMLQTF